MDWIEQVHGEHKDYYDGFLLMGSYRLFVPFYKMTLTMEYQYETGLNAVEDFVCRCIEQGVNNPKDVADVLALPENMLLYTTSQLEGNGYITVTKDSLELTALGKKLFQNRIKHESKQQSLTLFYDGLTPEYKIEFFGKDHEHRFYKYNQIDAALLNNVIAPQTFPTYEEERDYLKLSQRVLSFIREEANPEQHDWIKDKKVITIHSFLPEPSREVNYHEYLILVFVNKAGQYKLLAYDPCGLEFVDQRVTRSLQELMAKGQLKAMGQVTTSDFKDLDQIVTALLNYATTEVAVNENVREQSVQRLAEHKPLMVSQYIMNHDIRLKFLHYLKNAQESLYLISPWMNQYVVNEDFMISIHEMLKRGVKVTILYGIDDPHADSSTRDLKTHALAERMQKRFGREFKDQFTIAHSQTHEKLLICDNKYYINGSFNFLSYAADDDKFFRNEGSTYSEDPVLIEETLRLRFSHLLAPNNVTK